MRKILFTKWTLFLGLGLLVAAFFYSDWRFEQHKKTCFLAGDLYSGALEAVDQGSINRSRQNLEEAVQILTSFSRQEASCERFSSAFHYHPTEIVVETEGLTIAGLREEIRRQYQQFLVERTGVLYAAVLSGTTTPEAMTSFLETYGSEQQQAAWERAQPDLAQTFDDGYRAVLHYTGNWGDGPEHRSRFEMNFMAVLHQQLSPRGVVWGARVDSIRHGETIDVKVFLNWAEYFGNGASISRPERLTVQLSGGPWRSPVLLEATQDLPTQQFILTEFEGGGPRWYEVWPLAEEITQQLQDLSL